MNINCIVSCKRAAQVSTFNIRTAQTHRTCRTIFSKQEPAHPCPARTSVVHAEPTRMEKINKGIHLVTSSVWKNEAGASDGRVGIILTRTAFMRSYKILQRKDLHHVFQLKAQLTVITCNSPTKASSDEEAENLFCLKPSILQLI